MQQESALVVLVPQAESLVGALRARYDPSAQQGMGAHITVLYPFLPPSALTPEVKQVLEGCFSRHRPFRFILGSVGRFPCTAYLAPAPAQPFIALTEEAAAAFPGCPPYGGAFADIVPHLTVADTDGDSAERVASVLQQMLARSAPVESHCRGVHLLVRETTGWQLGPVFALAPG